MQTANEIRSAVDNIRYYSQQIDKLARQQLELDYKAGEAMGIAAKAGSIRFDCLAVMCGSCAHIEAYCGNIEANLESAVKQDKLLRKEEEEGEEK